MSIYISIIEDGRPPQLLRARGLVIPLAKMRDGSLSVTAQSSTPPTLVIIATDAGWLVQTATGHYGALRRYGSAVYSTAEANMSLAVLRYESAFDDNPVLFADLLAEPVVDLQLRFLGFTQTTALRPGDVVQLGGASFPLPYQPLVSTCTVSVQHGPILHLSPTRTLALNGSPITTDVTLEYTKTPITIAADGWLVTARFLPYDRATVYESV